MSREFSTEYNSDEFKLRLKKIIEVERDDNVETHIRQSIFFKDDSKLSGIVGNIDFRIWIYDYRNTGIFYPVIKGEFYPINGGLKVELETKMNIVGRIVVIIISAGLAYAIISGMVIQDDNELKFLVPRILVGILFFGVMNSIPTIIYFRTSRILKRYLTEELELKNMR